MILGQVDTNATTDTTLYTVPAKNIATLRVMAAERGGAGATLRIAIRLAGAVLANPQYIAYDVPLAANGTFTSAAIEIGEDDVVTVRASTGDVSWNANGLEEPEVE